MSYYDLTLILRGCHARDSWLSDMTGLVGFRDPSTVGGPLPMVTLAECLHQDEWYACDHPERPNNNRRIFHLDPCTGCLIVAEVELNSVNPLTEPELALAWAVVIDMVEPIPVNI